MALKKIDAFLEGEIRMIKDDSFPDKETKQTKFMTRVKLLTAPGTDNEAIHDVNFMWPDGSNARPPFLAKCEAGKRAMLPVVIKQAFDGKGIEVQGQK